MEYKRPDGGLEIYREARYIISLYLHFLQHIFIKTITLTICEGYMACHKGTTRGIYSASGTAYTRHLKV